MYIANPITKAILFDFDGTLINTNDLIVQGLNRFAISFRGTILTPEEHQFLVGKPLDDQMAYICQEKAEDMAVIFKLWYMDAHKALAKPFDGVAELFNFLKDSDYKLGIVSNNSRATVRMGLDQLGLSEIFDIVICCDDVTRRKPSPEGLQMAMKRLNVTAEETLFIGDTGSDLMAANNAGIRSVLVGWTALERAPLMHLEPSFVIEHPMELLQVIGVLAEMTA